MALKRKITADEFNGLSDALKEHYTENNGGYVLDADDAAELQTALAARQREAADAKRERDEAKRKLDEIEEAARAEREETERQRQRKDKDFDALETSWQEKVNAEKARGEQTAAKFKAQLEKLLVDNVAQSIASKISSAPRLLLPQIRERLAADFEGDAPRTRVLDENGQPSAKTLQDLEQEFVASSDFEAIILANRSGGGNATDPRGHGNAGKKFSELSETERVALHRENPERYRQLRDAG